MIASHNSRWRAIPTAIVGLALAFVVAAVVPLRADSGGFLCGYGDCYLLYEGEDCGSVNYEELGGGNCRITFTNPTDCDWDFGCDGERFSWIVDATSWETDPIEWK